MLWQEVVWKLICTIGLLLVGLAYAGTNSPPELLQQLQQAIQQGESDSARSQTDAALKQFPSDPGLYNLLGIVDAQRGNHPGDAAVEQLYQNALANAPEFTGALLNLGRLYLQQSADDSRAPGRRWMFIRKFFATIQTMRKHFLNRRCCLPRAGSYQSSLNHLNRLPTDVQQRAQALAIRCADHAGLKQTALAASAAERLLKSPDLSQADVISALPQVEAHDEALATKMLEGLVQRQLADRQGLSLLAAHYERQGKLPQARETLEQAEQSGAPSVEILSELARVAYQQRDRDGALGYLAHARDLDPRNAGVHFFFGVVCIELNLPLEARKSLDEAVRLDPENPYYNYALGAVAIHGSDPTQAIHYFPRNTSSASRKITRPVRAGRGLFLFGKLRGRYQESASRPGHSRDRAGSCYYLWDALPNCRTSCRKQRAN